MFFFNDVTLIHYSTIPMRVAPSENQTSRLKVISAGVCVGEGGFYDISTGREHPHPSLLTHFSLTGLSRVMASTVTKLARSNECFYEL